MNLLSRIQFEGLAFIVQPPNEACVEWVIKFPAVPDVMGKHRSFCGAIEAAYLNLSNINKGDSRLCILRENSGGDSFNGK